MGFFFTTSCLQARSNQYLWALGQSICRKEVYIQNRYPLENKPNTDQQQGFFASITSKQPSTIHQHSGFHRVQKNTVTRNQHRTQCPQTVCCMRGRVNRGATFQQQHTFNNNTVPFLTSECRPISSKVCSEKLLVSGKCTLTFNDNM